MEDFINAFIAYLKSNLALYAPIRIGAASAEHESLAIRPIPSPPGARYLDGYTDRIQVQLIAKSKNQEQAIGQIGAINQLILEGEGFPVNNHRLIEMDVYNSMQLIEQTDQNEYLYSAFYRAEIERG